MPKELEVTIMQGKSFQRLFTPLKIRGLELKNRIVMTPVQVNFSSDGMSNERYKEFFGLRARSGAALIMVEPVLVHKTQDLRVLSLYEDRFIPRLAELVETIHSNGALAGIQLNHLGRQGDLILKEGDPPLVAPSPLPWSPRSTVPKELSKDEIKELVEKFVEVAVRVKEAGFDMVEIHGAHGYLVSEFFSPLSNKRTDEYGGDAKGRARFAIEIIKLMRERLGSSFPISIRINGTDNIPGGIMLDDAKAIAPLLVEGGVDLISVSAGANGSYPTIVPGYEAVPACYVSLAEEIRGVVAVPVLAGGCISDLSLAEKVVETGKVDLVAMTRAFIADPEFIHKTLEGKTVEIRKCVRCNTCIDNSMYGSLICLVNPEAGREAESRISPVDRQKTVMIIGGGLAGMEAARVAATRGHRVIVYEEQQMPGGQWKLASKPPNKQVFEPLINYLSYQINRLHIEVNLGIRAGLAEIERLSPDVVVVATGAIPFIPPIPGVDNKRVTTAQDVLSGLSKTGNQVLVIGGGGIGLETAEFLDHMGRDVTVVEMLAKIGSGMGATVRWNIMNRLKERGSVKIFSSTKVEKIDNDYVVVNKHGKEETWQSFDTIVLAVGMKPRNELVDEIRKSVKEVYVIGDAAGPRKGVDAMREGSEVGRLI